ncbi:MAG: ATPase, T2SS/T4P/T4SS family [Nitriliruptoraceae bacterium]
MSAVDVSSVVGDQLRSAVSVRLRDDAELLAGQADRPSLRRAVARALAAEGVVAAPDVWARMVRDLVDDLAGLGPVEALLRDPEVTDVMINGADDVRVERAGVIDSTTVTFDDDEHLTGVVGRVLARRGVRLDRAHPYADAVMDDGSRLHVLLPPLASRPIVTLRRVPAVVPDWDDLARSGSVPAATADILQQMVRSRHNLIVSGSAGSGKTTLLSRLLGEVGDDRVVIIEDTPELKSPTTHAVHLRTRSATAEGVGQVTVADLVRNALRMRPDRIVVGEVRGHEVADLLQAMNTGHQGSMGTIHANGAEEALVRLEGMALLAGIPLAAAKAQVSAASVSIVTLIRDRDGDRKVDQICQASRSADGQATTEVVWSARAGRP